MKQSFPVQHPRPQTEKSISPLEYIYQQSQPQPQNIPNPPTKTPKNSIPKPNPQKQLTPPRQHPQTGPIPPRMHKTPQNTLQYQKLNTTIQESAEMKKQIEKYLFNKFNNWVTHLTEEQIKQVYIQIANQRRFLEAKQVKYQWLDRERRIRDSQRERNIQDKKEGKIQESRVQSQGKADQSQMGQGQTQKRDRIKKKCIQILKQKLAPDQSNPQPFKQTLNSPLKPTLNPSLKPTLTPSISPSTPSTPFTIAQHPYPCPTPFNIKIPHIQNQDTTVSNVSSTTTSNHQVGFTLSTVYGMEERMSPMSQLISTVDALRSFVPGGRESGEDGDDEGMGLPVKRVHTEGHACKKTIVPKNQSKKMKNKQDKPPKTNCVKIEQCSDNYETKKNKEGKENKETKENQKMKEMKENTEQMNEIFEMMNFIVLVDKLPLEK